MTDRAPVSSAIKTAIAHALATEVESGCLGKFGQACGLERKSVYAAKKGAWSPTLRTVDKIIAALPDEARERVLCNIRRQLETKQATGTKKLNFHARDEEHASHAPLVGDTAA